jgi:hypothetical protein
LVLIFGDYGNEEVDKHVDRIYNLHADDGNAIDAVALKQKSQT